MKIHECLTAPPLQHLGAQHLIGCRGCPVGAPWRHNEPPSPGKCLAHVTCIFRYNTFTTIYHAQPCSPGLPFVLRNDRRGSGIPDTLMVEFSGQGRQTLEQLCCVLPWDLFFIFPSYLDAVTMIILLILQTPTPAALCCCRQTTWAIGGFNSL